MPTPLAILRETYRELPPLMLEHLVAYRDHGGYLGDFLTCVVENDLAHAAGAADNTNIRLLHVYARFLINELPMAAWGSRERVAAWRARFDHASMPGGDGQDADGVFVGADVAREG